MNNYVNVHSIQVRMNCIWNLALKGEYEYDLLIDYRSYHELGDCQGLSSHYQSLFCHVIWLVNDVKVGMF
ncbi:Glycoprotein antigen BM86 [Gossypium arboreum]|uniref:Glycoprotein antigen BM86 n=1 Tax=Gossypium arboreum TaxID=29729 RepID=A0A0B0NKA5_GOSAR|nr:Glycoprotein antigen BM86 [Gossypium arboreum]